MSLFATLRTLRFITSSFSCRKPGVQRHSFPGVFVPVATYATKLQGSKTHANLKAAFAGESMVCYSIFFIRSYH
jgi:hypothetical protein